MPERPLPARPRILLAFDVGRKKTGIAVGNTLSGGARPVAVARGGRDEQLRVIGGYVGEWRPDEMVVGMPRRMDGRDNAMSGVCRRFADELRRRFAVPVRFADERLTSVAARRITADAGDADAAAAALILQDWLDARAASPH